MIDDSLVRGTTAGPLVKLIRDAGATEVHVRITCPPIMHPCHFGVDMGHDGDLMAARLTLEEIRERVGADSLEFLSLEGMMRAVGNDDGAETGYCNACFTGRYPLEVAEAQAKLSFEGVAGLMRVAVIGGGGREQAIAWACRRHGHDVSVARRPRRRRPRCHRPRDPGTGGGPRRRGGRSLCCRRRAVLRTAAALAELEASKGFARELATSLGIPGPPFARFAARRRRRRAGVVARARAAGRRQARRAGRRQGGHRAGGRCGDRGGDPRRRRPVRAGGADDRAGVLVAGPVRRAHRPGAAAGPGPQAPRRGRHRAEHRRDGRLRAGAGAVRR